MMIRPDPDNGPLFLYTKIASRTEYSTDSSEFCSVLGQVGKVSSLASRSRRVNVQACQRECVAHVGIAGNVTSRTQATFLDTETLSFDVSGA